MLDFSLILGQIMAMGLGYLVVQISDLPSHFFIQVPLLFVLLAQPIYLQCEFAVLILQALTCLSGVE